MIKIQDHLNIINPNLDFNTIIQNYWDTLNPKLKSGDYAHKSLIKKCTSLSNKITEPSYFAEFANNDKYIAMRHKKFFSYLKKDNFKKLKEIICAKPSEFDNLKTEILKILKIEDIFTIVNQRVKQTKFGELLTKSLFTYRSFRQSEYCITLYKSLGFNNCTCPYCNDSNIDIVYKVGSTDEIAYFDLDHFYPKSQNPFFALSFFNLIPSCKICNSTLKGDTEFSISTHIHPYHESFEYYYKFKIPIESFLTMQVDTINVITKITKTSDKTVSAFNIKNRYMNRKNKIEKLIKLYTDYSQVHPAEVFNQFILDTCDLPKNINDILNKQNGKLLRDIALQLDKPSRRLQL